MKKDYSVYCDIFVHNTMGNVKCFHRRVPEEHVKILQIAKHLDVKIIKTYKVDNSYKNHRKRSFNDNKKFKDSV